MSYSDYVPVGKQVPDRRIIWPAQCKCGHVYIERYEFESPNDDGHIGFCWCGYCRKKEMVKLREPVDSVIASVFAGKGILEDQKCYKCGRKGYSIDEFLSPYTGICAKCAREA